MKLTGRQLREARKLLGWSRNDFARKAFLTFNFADAIESTDGAAWLSVNQEIAIRGVYEAAGIEFAADEGEGSGVRLRKGEA